MQPQIAEGPGYRDPGIAELRNDVAGLTKGAAPKAHAPKFRPLPFSHSCDTFPSATPGFVLNLSEKTEAVGSIRKWFRRLVTLFTSRLSSAEANSVTGESDKMAVPLPNFGALRDAFASAPSMSNQSSDSAQAPRSRYQARQELYGTWSAVDDAKDKANKLSNAAVKELQQASAKAQQATGKIEMYSPKFYAACTTGGLLACVSHHRLINHCSV